MRLMLPLEMVIATAIALDNLPERECRVCGEMKAAYEMVRDAATRDGLGKVCRPCNRAYQAARRAAYKVKNEARNPYADPTPKRCPGCERDLSRTEFSRNARRPDGLTMVCRACDFARVSDWRTRNPEKYRAYGRVQKRRRRARKRENGTVPYDEADVFASNNWRCVYCGDDAEEIDHFIPLADGGADAPWNVVPTCRDCNRGPGGKFDRDPIEFLASRGIRFDRVV